MSVSLALLLNPSTVPGKDAKKLSVERGTRFQRAVRMEMK